MGIVNELDLGLAHKDLTVWEERDETPTHA